MSGSRRWKHRWGGWVCGGGTTAACCVLLVLGRLRGLDDYGLDLHFRHFSTIDADDRIVLIDIDDGSLEAVGNWPWPRRRHAELVRTLDRLGAEVIALDLIFSDRTQPRLVETSLSLDADSNRQVRRAPESLQWPLIDDDAELQEAIAAAGNVYLAMYGRLEDSRSAFSERTAKEAGSATLVRRKRDAARRSAVEYVDRNPAGSWREFLAFAGEDPADESISPRRLMLTRALGWARARRETLASHAVAESTGSLLRFEVVDPEFPLAGLVRAARGVGFVAYLRDASDGIVREVPMVVGLAGGALRQFGFALTDDLWRSAGRSERADRDSPDNESGLWRHGNGLTLINWHVAQSGRDWRDSFVHIPAARVLEIEDARRAVQDNERRLGIALAELVETRFANTPAEYADYVSMVNGWLDVRRQLERAVGNDRPRLSARAAAIHQSLDAVERDARTWLEHAWGLWKEATPLTSRERSQRQLLSRLHAKFAGNKLESDLADKNRRLQDRMTALEQELRPKLERKICLVGYTASAQGDFVATPVQSAMPGVMVHANIVNMLLQERVPVRVPLGWDVALLLSTGIAVTLASGAKGWQTGVAATAALGALVAVIGALLFASQTVHLATIPAIVTTLAVWAVVTVWRQSTAERTRRSLTRALTQYASPAVASRITAELSVDDLAPESAGVTCVFCDLAGFTSMSESVGPRRTRDILNPYLVATSKQLVEHGALVNKFIGDGVFAFFNAPILPCDDRTTRACEAALAIRRNVAQLDGADGEALAVRIGIATGEAFVGDYGSGVKLDYTCIGDSVNVGSRLERAAKVLAASILVDRATRETAGAGLVFRPMGRLRVPGRQAAVEAFEVLDPACRRHAARIASIDRFAAALRCFQGCQWDDSLSILDELLGRDPEDGVLSAYRRAVQSHRRAGPPEDWDGALKVTSA